MTTSIPNNLAAASITLPETASEFFLAALGEHSSHSRSAVGVAGLPMNAAVEIEAVFEIG